MFLLAVPQCNTVVNHALSRYAHPCEDYIFTFASSATKKISESVVETAQTIKKTVEEGKIEGIIDKACVSNVKHALQYFLLLNTYFLCKYVVKSQALL